MEKSKEYEIRIRKLSKHLKKEVDNIAANLNIDKSSMLKPIIQNWVDSQPERLKKEPIKDW